MRLWIRLSGKPLRISIKRSAPALNASAWLIVVCSKRTPASSWVTQEIAHFAAARRDRVLVLLVDGEPEESYPAPLLEGGEPKAAHIRASSRTRTLAKLKRSEKLALLAPILGVRFDDLKLRERQRQRRRAVAAFSVAGTLLMGFALMLAMIRTESLREPAPRDAGRDRGGHPAE